MSNARPRDSPPRQHLVRRLAQAPQLPPIATRAWSARGLHGAGPGCRGRCHLRLACSLRGLWLCGSGHRLGGLVGPAFCALALAGSGAGGPLGATLGAVPGLARGARRAVAAGSLVERGLASGPAVLAAAVLADGGRVGGGTMPGCWRFGGSMLVRHFVVRPCPNFSPL